LKLLYAEKNETKTEPKGPPEDKKKAKILLHKGHELVAISFHVPTACELCPKPLWHMLNPPALECKRNLHSGFKGPFNNCEGGICILVSIIRLSS